MFLTSVKTVKDSSHGFHLKSKLTGEQSCWRERAFSFFFNAAFLLSCLTQLALSSADQKHDSCDVF